MLYRRCPMASQITIGNSRSSAATIPALLATKNEMAFDAFRTGIDVWLTMVYSTFYFHDRAHQRLGEAIH